MPDDDLHRLTGRLRHLLTSPGDEKLIVLFGAGMSVPNVPGVGRLTKMAREFSDQAGSPPVRADLNEPVPVYRSVQQMRIARYLEAMQFVQEVRGSNGIRQFLQTAVLHAHDGPGWTVGDHPVPDDEFLDLQKSTSGWHVPEGLALFADLLRTHGSRIHNMLLTTNFDPLLEVALHRAGIPSVASYAVFPPNDDMDRIPLDPARWTVVHLHGDCRYGTAHYPAPLTQGREPVADWLSRQLRGNHLLVLGYSGWDGLVQQTLQSHYGRESDGKSEEPVEVMWAVYEGPQVHPQMNPDLDEFFERYRMRGVTPYYSVDRDRVLRTLAEELDGRSTTAGDTLRTTGSAFYRTVKQLNIDYGFGLSRMRPDTSPTFVFWPHRLRKAHLIHGVHAITAALLSKLGIPIELHLDDTDMHPNYADSTAAGLVQAITGWFDKCGAPTLPRVFRISELIRSGSIEDRATQLWLIARDWYTSSTSVFEALLAAKVVRVEADTVSVIPNQATRLLRPMYTWLALEDAVGRLGHGTGRNTTAITLGGADEHRMWDLWRARPSAPQLGSLYVPRLESPNEGAKLWDYTELHLDTPFMTSDLERFLFRSAGSSGGGDQLLKWVFLAAHRLAVLAGGSAIGGPNSLPTSWLEMAEQVKRTPADACKSLAEAVGAWFYHDV